MPAGCCPGWNAPWLRSFPPGPECACGIPAGHSIPKLNEDSFSGDDMLGRAMVAAGLGGVLCAHALADLPDGGLLALVSGGGGLAWMGWRICRRWVGCAWRGAARLDAGHWPRVRA